MFRQVIFGLVMSLIFGVSIYAQEEETITITTYYPSPHGSYNELEINRLHIGRAGQNTDPLWIERADVGNDRSEFRIGIGDNTGRDDSFAVGIIPCPTCGGNPGVWNPLFTVRNDGSARLTNTITIQNDQELFVDANNSRFCVQGNFCHPRRQTGWSGGQGMRLEFFFAHPAPGWECGRRCGEICRGRYTRTHTGTNAPGCGCATSVTVRPAVRSDIRLAGLAVFWCICGCEARAADYFDCPRGPATRCTQLN